MISDKWCGNCDFFSDESISGLGVCEMYDHMTSCDDICECWAKDTERFTETKPKGGKMDNERIEKEFNDFFSFPNPSNKLTVSSVSAKLFASMISELTKKECDENPDR